MNSVQIPIGDRTLYLDIWVILALWLAFKVLFFSLRWARNNRTVPLAYRLPLISVVLFILGTAIYHWVAYRPGLFFGVLLQVLGLIFLLNGFSGWFANRQAHKLLALNILALCCLFTFPALNGWDLAQLRSPTYAEEDMANGTAKGIDIRSGDLLAAQLQVFEEAYLPYQFHQQKNLKLLSIEREGKKLSLHYILNDYTLPAPQKAELDDIWTNFVCKHNHVNSFAAKEIVHVLIADSDGREIMMAMLSHQAGGCKGI